MLAACHILFVMGLDFMLLVLLVLTSSVRACHAWYNFLFNKEMSYEGLVWPDICQDRDK